MGDCFAVPLLQEDYHKLLTKYAEAENTIDQLRLGAKVPSRGGEVWALPPGDDTFPIVFERGHCLLPPETLGVMEPSPSLFYHKVTL